MQDKSLPYSVRVGAQCKSFQVRRVVRTNSSWMRGPGRGVPAVASTHWSTAGARRRRRRAASGSCSPATCRCYTSRSGTSSSSSRCAVCSTHCKYSARLKPKKKVIIIEITFLVWHENRTNYKSHQKHITSRKSFTSFEGRLFEW